MCVPRRSMNFGKWALVSVGLMENSSLAPDEQSGHRVIPDHAHQGAGGARKPPDRLLVVNREGHADIGQETDAANEIEQQQAADDCKALQPLVAIGQEVVEDEVAGHGANRAKGLGLRERKTKTLKRRIEPGEVNDDAERTDHRK